MEESVCQDYEQSEREEGFNLYSFEKCLKSVGREGES